MPEYKFNYEITNKTVETLVDQMKKSKKWILKPEYQRDVVWAEGQKGNFISSIIEGVAIPPIIYNFDPKTEKYICIDGQQRLVALLDYTKNRFGVQIEDDLVFYNDIPEEYEEEEDVRKMNSEEKNRFNLRNLVVFQYDNLKYIDQIDIFLRNQYGKTLTPGEKIKSRIKSSEVSKEYHQFCDKQYELIQKFCKRDRRQHLAFIIPLVLIASTEEETIPNAKRVDKYLKELTIEVLHQDLKETEKLLKVLFSKNLLNSQSINQKAPVNLIYIMALYLVMNQDLKALRDDPTQMKILRKAFSETINFIQTSTTLTANKSKDMTEKIIKIIETKVAQFKLGKGKISDDSDQEESSDQNKESDDEDDKDGGENNLDSDDTQESEQTSEDDATSVDEEENHEPEADSEDEEEKIVVPPKKSVAKATKAKSIKIEKLDESDDSDIEELIKPAPKGKIKRYVRD